MNFEIILEKYGLDTSFCDVLPFGTGLINSTWIINDKNSNNQYILQRVNEKVFKQPADIALNIELIDTFLKKNHPDYLFTSPLRTIKNNQMFCEEPAGHFRIFPFVPGSNTLVTLAKPAQAYEAAKQFGKFTSLLADLDASQLKITIPDFHNLELRFSQFNTATNNFIEKRNEEAKLEIAFLSENNHIADKYKKIILSGNFKHRVTHHDTKISNVLFDKSDKGLCVIDLDTVMPGYFISDVGDMFRTFLSPVNEEEKDFSKIEARPDFFRAITEGYLSEMNNTLSLEEKESFVYAGEFMIYMQALRFLTDYLMGDIYYHANYKDHNLVRAKNQIYLLKCYQKQKKQFNNMVAEYSKT